MPAKNGKQYLEGLRDSRDIWIYGQKVSDVTTHHALANMAQTMGMLYDMQHDERYKDILTYPSPSSGKPVGVSYLMPRSQDDLIRRRMMVKTWADATFGWLGRSPDFLNTVLMNFAAKCEYFGQDGHQFGQNVYNYYEYCRENDICLTHALIDPQVDRSLPPSDPKASSVYLSCIKETDQGIIVRGAKMLATLAPFADELMVYPFRPYAENEQSHVLGFAIRLSTPGLRLICRESFDTGRSTIDRPLSSRYDEMDAMVIFEDVLIPWERVFLYRNIQLANSMRKELLDFSLFIHQVEVRTLSNIEFILGVALSIADCIGIGNFPNIQELLGEMVNHVEMVKACIIASEAGCRTSPEGVVYPDVNPLEVIKASYPRIYPRLIEIIQILAAGGLMMTPTEEDLQGPLRPLIDKYYQGRNTSAIDRIKLFRLAWDLAGSDFGSRHVLYERFYTGGPLVVMTNRFKFYDRKEELMNLAKRLLSNPQYEKPVSPVSAKI